jgi:hypothetical protein
VAPGSSVLLADLAWPAVSRLVEDGETLDRYLTFF